MIPQALLVQGIFEGIIALAYFAIATMLLNLAFKRAEEQQRGTVATFAALMVVCGIAQIVGLWSVWHSLAWLGPAITAVSALLSVGTAALLIPVLSKAPVQRTPVEFERLDLQLQQTLLACHAALSETERQCRSLAEALPQLVWTADADGCVDYYNQRWLDYTGMTFEECQPRGWEPVLHPDDVANCLAAWTESVTNGTPYEVEFRFRRARDGAYRWHLGLALPMRDSAGSIRKWFGTCTDIDDQKCAAEAAERLNLALAQDIRKHKRVESALRESDERFRQVEEHAPIGLALVATDGRFIRVNPALCTLTGYSREELLSTTFHLLTHPEDLEAYLAHVQRMLDGSIVSYVMEKRYVHKEGRIVWILLSWSIVRGENDDPSYFISQIQDISERKAAEQAAKTAKTAALVAADTKSRFLATMSHEIRTPMNGIIGMAELLSLSELSVEQNEYVKVVRDSGQSLLRVLNDILDYSKVEAGKLDVETMDFELLSQIRSVVALLGPQFRTKGVSLTMDVNPEVPVILKGDPGRVRQILINLVGNALKFTPAQGGVRILVSSEHRNAKTVILRFAITDSGVGIAPDVQHRLFQPFSQVDGSTTRKHGGTGLGLAICKQLVDLMGGRIGVESALNSGSSFWFTLPFLQGSSVASTLDAPAREMGERRAAVRLRPEKLLLAEDNEVNILLAIRQFKQLGFSLAVVHNGRQAVEAVRRNHYDIVFMDCHMPELDGWDAAREIRTLASDLLQRVPIVAMTADAQMEDRLACLAAGMDDYISKPSTLSDLRTVLERWLPSKTQSATGSAESN